MSQWVQHISGNGIKWEVNPSYNCSSEWMVKAAIGGSNHHFLPKSEYVMCDTEQWEDVTEHCKTDGSYFIDQSRQNKMVCSGNYYRVRKVRHGEFGYAFIVERKKP